MEVGVRQLRAGLAAAVRRAGAGQRIVVTVDGRPAAQLGPIEASGPVPVTLADLAARGQVLAARRADRPPPDLLVPVQVGTRLDRLLAEIRA
jgi:prevent-host-death family protein